MHRGRRPGGTESSERLAPAALALAFAVLLIVPAGADPIAVSSRVIPLNEQDSSQVSVGVLRYGGGIELSSSHRDFGGLSGLRVSADGSILHAVTDHGMLLTARLSYDADGMLSALTNAELTRLPGSGDSRRDGDAEALTEDGTGGWIVAFEQHHRLVRFADGGTVATEIPLPSAVGALPRNSGIEALGRLPDGRLLMFAEHAAADGVHQGWLGDERGWQALSYAAATNFAPTDLVSLPSGEVLVVERAFHPLGGWGARVVRLGRASLVPGKTVRGEELALLRPPLNIDNFEGIAAIPEAGAVRIYLVSDDNFNFLERTLLLTFQWREPRP